MPGHTSAVRSGRVYKREACNNCSAAKRGCSREHPICSRCSRLSLSCHYQYENTQGNRSVRHGSTPPAGPRKSLASEKREKVHMIRIIGACLRCRIKKKECDAHLHCAHCSAFGNALSRSGHMCIREKLTALRYTELGRYLDTIQLFASNGMSTRA
ncbi:hypothetical protein M501DRAFT_533009 [Patellaria atrata CBS 101060]|uniref:Zn(2)-C6 fungal-type domain-containing protein n=1 Tax=Patellaria atrata CBS 101060 TaxID=1346257 RepID=A0A9P4SED3_9PEZI|nr:hypothetical protein M501DRAFT_533009 [Patellaria atrata CBS 101060]